MFKHFLFFCLFFLNTFVKSDDETKSIETCQNTYICFTKLTDSLTSNKCNEFEQFVECINENPKHCYDNYDRLFQFCSSTCPVFSICNRIKEISPKKTNDTFGIILATLILSAVTFCSIITGLLWISHFKELLLDDITEIIITRNEKQTS